MATSRLELGIGLIRFPPDCAGCGRSGATPAELVRFRGIDVGLEAVGDTLRLAASLCRACRRRRGAALALGRVASLALAVGLFAGPILALGARDLRASDFDERAVLATVLAIFALMLGLVGLLRSRLPTLADRLALGVWIAAWDPGRGTATLAFARAELAAAVAARAEELRAGG